MDRRKLTKDDVERAETYIPLAMKYAVAQVLAPGGIEQAEGTPPIWQENTIGRRLVELYILTGFYLHITDVSGLDQETPLFQFTLEDYDWLCGAARELEDLGGEDILRDYADFLCILDRQIGNLLAQKNDLLARLGELARMGATPEALQELQKAVGHVGPDDLGGPAAEALEDDPPEGAGPTGEEA